VTTTILKPKRQSAEPSKSRRRCLQMLRRPLDPLKSPPCLPFHLSEVSATTINQGFPILRTNSSHSSRSYLRRFACATVLSGTAVHHNLSPLQESPQKRLSFFVHFRPASPTNALYACMPVEPCRSGSSQYVPFPRWIAIPSS